MCYFEAQSFRNFSFSKEQPSRICLGIATAFTFFFSAPAIDLERKKLLSYGKKVAVLFLTCNCSFFICFCSHARHNGLLVLLEAVLLEALS